MGTRSPGAAVTRAVVYDAIDTERDYQDRRYGNLEEHPHTVGEWILILRTELDEAERGWTKGKGDTEALSEIVKLAGVAVACLEQHGVVLRGS